ncbi:MAG TPA: outer membrane protein assembly factor BamD [Blastocatellia bacterium]|nr:outer membrane protein assembly factor BamD [Blastocatellia bacterium]
MQLRKLGTIVLLLFVALGSACGPKADKKVSAKNKVENTPGRDKEIFEGAIAEMRKGRYERGRIDLETLITTYVDSPYLPLAKLAIADSYFREGGTSNLAQAEAEYQNWLSFFATTQRDLAPQVLYKMAEIHMRQMLAPDRDQHEALKAERTLMQLVQNYPDAANLPEVKTKLDEIRERLADADFNVATFYYNNRNAWAGAESRLKEIIEKYPNYTKMDEVYHLLGMTEVQREDTEQAGKYFSMLAQKYPNSEYFQDSVDHLKKFEMNVPNPDPNAPPRREKAGFVGNMKAKVFEPTIQTNDDGILITKDGKTNNTVVKALQDANNAWTNSPTPVTTTVGASKTGTGGTTAPGQANPSGTVKVGVGGPDKPDDKDKKGPIKPNN